MVTSLPTMADGALLTATQLAETLQCHRNTIRMWQTKGLLAPKYHTRGRKVYMWKDVKDFYYHFF